MASPSIPYVCRKEKLTEPHTPRGSPSFLSSAAERPLALYLCYTCAQMPIFSVEIARVTENERSATKSGKTIVEHALSLSESLAECCRHGQELHFPTK